MTIHADGYVYLDEFINIYFVSGAAENSIQLLTSLCCFLLPDNNS